MEAATALEAPNHEDAPSIRKTPSGKEVKGPSKRERFMTFMEESSKVEMHSAAATQLRRSAEDFGILVEKHRFDADPYVFACASGLIDLRAGTIRDTRPDDYISVMSPVTYDPNTPIPHFMRFLETSHPDPEVRDFIQKVLGYSMTGATAEQKMFIHHGASTANGKSVLMSVLSEVLGDHFKPAPEKALLKQRAGTSRSGQDMVDLVGPRFLALNETNQGASLDGEIIKSITSGEQRADRGHNSENVKYRVTGKIHLITNHLPHITADEAMGRRIIVIPWTQSFSDNPDRILRRSSRASSRGSLLGSSPVPCAGTPIARHQATAGLASRPCVARPRTSTSARRTRSAAGLRRPARFSTLHLPPRPGLRRVISIRRTLDGALLTAIRGGP